MVVALGPGRFYGSALPRPRFYDDVKFNDVRVDAPLPVLDPLLDWAREAHWSMGGLSFQRRRLQGRIEGSIKKLRAEAERCARKNKVERGSGGRIEGSVKKLRAEPGRPANKRKKMERKADGGGKKRRVAIRLNDAVEDAVREKDEDRTTEAPPAPLRRLKRRTATPEEGAVGDFDESAKTKPIMEEPEPSPMRTRRKSARKLGDEFDRVADLPNREAARGSGLPSPVGNLPNPVPSPLRQRSKEALPRTSPRLRRQGPALISP